MLAEPAKLGSGSASRSLATASDHPTAWSNRAIWWGSDGPSQPWLLPRSLAPCRRVSCRLSQDSAVTQNTGIPSNPRHDPSVKQRPAPPLVRGPGKLGESPCTPVSPDCRTIPCGRSWLFLPL